MDALDILILDASIELALSSTARVSMKSTWNRVLAVLLCSTLCGLDLNESWGG